MLLNHLSREEWKIHQEALESRTATDDDIVDGTYMHKKHMQAFVCDTLHICTLAQKTSGSDEVLSVLGRGGLLRYSILRAELAKTVFSDCFDIVFVGYEEGGDYDRETLEIAGGHRVSVRVSDAI